MKFLKLFLIALVPLTVFSQNYNFNLSDKTELFNSKSLIQNNSYSQNKASLFDSLTTEKETKVKGSKKSPGLAFIYGILVPGMGHVYADRFSTGKYFMISEAVLWLTYAAFSIYGNWMLDDAYDYSGIHAGVQVEGKDRDDQFFVDIANYNNVDQYNDEKLRFGEYDKLYYPEQGYGFYWDTEENRMKYREDKIAGDRTLNDRLFVVGAVVINHLISGISAVFAANGYNDDLKKNKGGGISLSAGIQKHFNRIDGIKLKFTKLF
jgi:hypothetical protein